MPPKRKSIFDLMKARDRKRARADRDGDESRWSAVSLTGNEDVAYKKFLRDPVKAFSYNCFCKSKFIGALDDGDEPVCLNFLIRTTYQQRLIQKIAI